MICDDSLMPSKYSQEDIEVQVLLWNKFVTILITIIIIIIIVVSLLLVFYSLFWLDSCRCFQIY